MLTEAVVRPVPHASRCQDATSIITTGSGVVSRVQCALLHNGARPMAHLTRLHAR